MSLAYLLSRLSLVDKNSMEAEDAACARAVASFQGDINETIQGLRQTPLICALQHRAPLTIAALADRGDVNPYQADACGRAPACWAMVCRNIQRFLDTFKGFDVNAPCVERTTPLALSAWLHDRFAAQVLLDAGAEAFPGMINDDVLHITGPDADQHIIAIIRVHEQWFVSIRRSWVIMCVASMRDSIEPCVLNGTASGLFASVLSDPRLRCVDAERTHRLASEHASLVALFL